MSELSQKQVETLTYQVKYQNIAKDKILVNQPPKEFMLTIRASGWDLLAHKLNLKKSDISIDLRSVQYKKSFPTSFLLTKLKNQLPEEYELLNITPDSLIFKLDDRIRKSLKIKARYSIQFEKQFDLSGKVIIEPDSVLVEGPVSIINELTEWPSDSISLKKVTQSINQKIKLSKPKNLSVKLSLKETSLIIPVEEFTEGNQVVLVRLVNQPSNTSILFYPKKVIISYQVSLSNYQRVTANMFNVIVDYKDILNKEFSNKVNIKVTQSPPFVKNIKTNPARVEYILYE